MGFGRVDAREVLSVRLVVDRKLREVLALQQLVLFLENPRVLTVSVGLVIVPVLHHFVDEEQRQDLDALCEQLLFLVQVRLDRLTDLDAADVALGDVAVRLTGAQHFATREFDRVVHGVDLADREAAILVHLARLHEQVIAELEPPKLALDLARLQLHLHLDPRHGGLLRDFDAFEVEIGVGAGQPAGLDAAHRDLLDQLLVVGVQRVQPVNAVVLGPVGRGIAQDEQRLELWQRLHRRRAFHLLRLVQDQDRPVRGDHVDGLARLEVVQLFIDAPVVGPACVERLDIDHHHVNAGVGRKALQLVQALGIVDEEPCLLAVAFREVVGRDLKRLVDAFANGDRRHHDDELRPAVPLVHLEEGLDVAVGLASAGLHLDVEVDAGRGERILRVGRLDGDTGALAVESREVRQRLRDGQVLASLDLLEVLQDLHVGQRKVGVLEAFLEGAGLRLAAGVDAVG